MRPKARCECLACGFVWGSRAGHRVVIRCPSCKHPHRVRRPSVETPSATASTAPAAWAAGPGTGANGWPGTAPTGAEAPTAAGVGIVGELARRGWVAVRGLPPGACQVREPASGQCALAAAGTLGGVNVCPVHRHALAGPVPTA